MVILPYLLLICISLAGGPLLTRQPQYKRRYLLVCGLAFWLLASLRYVTGFDYRFYETVFQTVADTSALSELGWIEPGYLLLNLWVALLGGDYRTFLFVFHLLFTVLVFTWIDRFSPSPWLSTYLFLTLQYFALSMNFLRQALAAAVILWIYPFLKSHRFFPCLGLILLASCFHWTALIMLPLSLLLTLRPSIHHYCLLALVAGLTYFLMDPLIEFLVTIVPKYRHYLTEKYWQGNSVLYVLIPLFCFLFALPLMRQTAHDASKCPLLINSIFYSFLIQIFITRHFILERLSIYSSLFSLAALPEAASISNGQCSSRIRTGILSVAAMLYFLFAVSQGFHGVYPYFGIWNKAIVP